MLPPSSRSGHSLCTGNISHYLSWPLCNLLFILSLSFSYRGSHSLHLTLQSAASFLAPGSVSLAYVLCYNLDYSPSASARASRIRSAVLDLSKPGAPAPLLLNPPDLPREGDRVWEIGGLCFSTPWTLTHAAPPMCQALLSANKMDMLPYALGSQWNEQGKRQVNRQCRVGNPRSPDHHNKLMGLGWGLGHTAILSICQILLAWAYVHIRSQRIPFHNVSAKLDFLQLAW